MDGKEISYRIDRENRLVDVGGDWDAFALQNDAPALRREAVLGRPLLDFISGDETRHFHEVLLARVRSGAQLRRLPFRCDSPELRRFMEMDITSPDGGTVDYCCRVLSTEAHAPVHTADAAPAGKRTMRMCSWCKKVHLTGSLWVEIEEAIVRFNLLEDAAPPHVSHGMCDACLEQLYGREE